VTFALFFLAIVASLVSAQTPLNCSWSSWSTWTQCSGNSTCNYGTASRTRYITSPAQNGGSCTGSTSEITSCNVCKADCSYNRWSSWSTCSAPCDNGVTLRNRTIKTVAAYGGIPCTQLLAEANACTSGSCSTYCMWRGWSEWSPCSRTCAGGIRTRNHTQMYNPIADKQTTNTLGIYCNYTTAVSEVCNSWNCLDCVWGEWTHFSPCSVECGGGQMRRTRAVLQHIKAGGKPCEGLALDELQCNYFVCSVVANENDKRQLSTFVIISSVLGSILGLILIALAIFVVLFFKRRNLNRNIAIQLQQKREAIIMQKASERSSPNIENLDTSSYPNQSGISLPRVERDGNGTKFTKV